ncbi:hypothetical protein C0J52_16108 [Blattella germanica]|nr:hypothetical protein C0J52_16108 [Blattella germanica]
MGCKVHLLLLLSIIAVLQYVSASNPSATDIRQRRRDGPVVKNNKILNSHEKHGSASHFVPSFGPIGLQNPDPYNPYQFHLFGPSPISAYRYMSSHGYPYACTFPYSRPFVPSPRDYYLDAHEPPSFYYPHQHFKYPYAEHYPNYLPPGYHPHHHPQYFPGQFHHNSGYYPSHSVPFHGHYPHHFGPVPHPSPRHLDHPHNNPHAFHSVVNYGHINLHHGDHFEPHDNGKTTPYVPSLTRSPVPLPVPLPPAHNYHFDNFHPGFYPHNFPRPYLNSLGEPLKPRSQDVEIDKESKGAEIEKIHPK